MVTFHRVVLAVFLSGIALSASGVAQAGTYYVDPVRGNDDYSGSSGSPWKTITHAAANAANGSTVFLRNGSYGGVSLNGISSSRTSWGDAILFTPDSGHTPVFGKLLIANMERCYMQFDGIDIDCQWAGLGEYGCKVIDASHVKLTNLDIVGLWDDDDKNKITGYGVLVDGENANVSDVLIEGCDITQVSIVAQTNGRIRSGLVLRGNTGTKINSSLLRFATDLQNDTILVEYNRVAEYRGIGNPHGSGLSIRNSNMTIRGNIIRAYGGSGGIRFYQNAANSGAVPEGGYSNILCEGNLIYGSNVSTGIFAPYIGHDFIFRNNTFVAKWVKNPPSSGRWRYIGGANFGLDPAGTGKNVKIHNNVLIGLITISQALIDAGVEEDHNIMWTLLTGKLQFQSEPLGDHSVIACRGYYTSAPFSDTYFETPGKFFVGTGSFDEAFDNPSTTPNIDAAFQLVDDAIGVGAGSAADASPYCLEGLPRVSSGDASVDIGAYEYRAGTTTNWAPVLDSEPDRTVAVNESLSITLSASDADGDSLTYSATGLPDGATFSGQSFAWTPTTDQAGTYDVTFRVTDGQLSDSETVTITVGGSTVVASGQPSLDAIGNQSVDENEALSFAVSASDPDDDAITYSASDLPSGASFVSQNFTWTPTYDQAGTYQVTFAASDGENEDTETVTITVSNVNRAPVLSALSDQSVDEQTGLEFAVSAQDPDGDTVTYTASGLPSGASLTGGSFSWTPTSSQIGEYDVTFIASDGQLQDSEAVTLYVVGTGPDGTAPTVARCNPEPDAIQVVLNNLVTLHVTDSGQGVDPESVVIQVDGDVVYQGDEDIYTSDTGKCTRSGTWADYRYIYQPEDSFNFDHAVTVTVTASDRAGNTLNDYTFSFTTEMRAFGSNQVASDETGLAGHPTTVGDANGNIWAAWHTGAEGSRVICVAQMDGHTGAFATPVVVSTNSGDQCNPNMALDANGQLYLTWQDNSQGSWDIYVASSSDGTTWSRPTQVTDAEDNETRPVIAVDSQSSARVYVAWQDDRNGNADIYVASSTSVFAESTIAAVTTDSADQYDPDIAVDGANVACLVWTDMRNGQADIYGATSEGYDWVNVPVVTSTQTQTDPALAAEADSSVLHLVWVNGGTRSTDIYYASSEGLPDSPVTGETIIDDTSGADQFAPVIVCHDDMSIFACWQDLRNSTDTDLYLTELSSGSAKTNILVGDNGTNGDQSEPALGIDGYGNPYLVWTDDRNAQEDIYFAATTFIDPNPLDSKLVVASEGATVGPAPDTIDEPEDVSLVIPAGACQCDVRITISEILNPQAMPVECLGSYDFGPSGIDFDEPVTVTIPYYFSGSESSAKPYWYDSLTGVLSQQGITDIQNIVVAADLNALQFKTTHFTPFYLMAAEVDTTDLGSAESSGGCSVSPTGKGSPRELLVPYGIIAVVMVALRRWDRKKKAQYLRTTRG